MNSPSILVDALINGAQIIARNHEFIGKARRHSSLMTSAYETRIMTNKKRAIMHHYHNSPIEAIIALAKYINFDEEWQIKED